MSKPNFGAAAARTGLSKRLLDDEEDEDDEDEEEMAPRSQAPPTSPRKATPLESPRGGKSGPLSRVSSKESFSMENPLSISRNGSTASLSRSSSATDFKRKYSK